MDEATDPQPEVMPSRWLRWVFFAVVVRPLLLVIVGLNVRNRSRLPSDGPAVLAANHNSHLDTLALMCLFPMKMLPKLRPVAAADYFMGSGAMAWFATRLMGIIPLRRSGGAHDMHAQFARLDAALERGEILILFPEGSRGEPERLSKFKTGIGLVAARHPTIPVYPILMHGFGKVLPKGEGLLVPFFCDVFVDEPMTGYEDRKAFVADYEQRMHDLASEVDLPPWE